MERVFSNLIFLIIVFTSCSQKRNIEVLNYDFYKVDTCLISYNSTKSCNLDIKFDMNVDYLEGSINDFFVIQIFEEGLLMMNKKIYPNTLTKISGETKYLPNCTKYTYEAHLDNFYKLNKDKRYKFRVKYVKAEAINEVLQAKLICTASIKSNLTP
jgi:hypothetical protein